MRIRPGNRYSVIIFPRSSRDLAKVKYLNCRQCFVITNSFCCIIVVREINIYLHLKTYHYPNNLQIKCNFSLSKIWRCLPPSYYARPKSSYLLKLFKPSRFHEGFKEDSLHYHYVGNEFSFHRKSGQVIWKKAFPKIYFVQAEIEWMLCRL